MRYLITNNAPGPRQVLTPYGGATIEKGGQRVFELSTKELEYARPYFDSGDLSYREAGADEGLEDPGLTITGLLPTLSSAGAKMVGANTTDTNTPVDEGSKTPEMQHQELLDEVEKDVTNVKHLGFGRWFGMKGDEKVTEAMNRQEAEAFAAEHNVPMGDEPDPTAGEAGDEGAPEEPATPPDNQE